MLTGRMQAVRRAAQERLVHSALGIEVLDELTAAGTPEGTAVRLIDGARHHSRLSPWDSAFARPLPPLRCSRGARPRLMPAM